MREIYFANQEKVIYQMPFNRGRSAPIWTIVCDWLGDQ